MVDLSALSYNMGPLTAFCALDSIQIEGLEWPESLSAFLLMGPKNRKGRFRWYVMHIKESSIYYAIKVDNSLDRVQFKQVTEKWFAQCNRPIQTNK